MSTEHLKDILAALPKVVLVYRHLDYAYRIGDTDIIERYHEACPDLEWFEIAKNRIKIEAEQGEQHERNILSTR